MKYGLMLCFLILVCLPLSAQKKYIAIKDAPEKLKNSYNDAYAYIHVQQYERGIKEMQKILKKNPDFINPYLVIADSYRQLEDLENAILYLNKAVEVAPDYEIRVYLLLGQLQLEHGKYEDSRGNLKKFMNYEGAKEEQKERARRFLADVDFREQAVANPVPFEPKNLGQGVNSERREYFPSITVAEDMLVYTVQIGNDMRNAQEDLYFSIKTDGVWGKGQPVPNVNTLDNEGAQAISADGKLLVFTACNRPSDFGSCDLYYSKRISATEWTKPKNIGQPINSAAWESQPSVAPNGDAIYFARGAQGAGQKDLYVSYLQPDGRWGKPEPLTEINTTYDETAPCIHPDGKTLYFASNGYAGMGSFDLYMSRKGADGKFSKPVNLGYPINSNKAEESIVVSLKGENAFISSDRDGGYGLLDIYGFTLPPAVRPLPVTYTQIVVRDAITKKVINGAKLDIINLTTETTFFSASTDREGEVLACLPLGEDYAANIQRTGYLFHSEQFELKADLASDKPYLLTIYLQNIPSKENTLVSKNDSTPLRRPIVLKNVFFNTNSAELRPISKTELDQLKKMLDENPNMRIQISGHTDSDGDDAKNQLLSENRAKAVRNYLIEKGIVATRLEAKGYGETQPIDSNDRPEGRARNRRTEFLVLSNQ
jgi:outer membrane protein OmpA-like peptidoglycan-associated protein/tetratricopeptide (TPR) repeat protein